MIHSLNYICFWSWNKYDYEKPICIFVDFIHEHYVYSNAQNSIYEKEKKKYTCCWSWVVKSI